MRARRNVLAAALVLGMTLGRDFVPSIAPAAAHAQQPAPTVAQPAEGASAAESPAYQAAPAQGGLPARAEAPRTLRAHWHVFTAFAIAWALLFGYALALGRRFARLERSLATVRAGA